MTLCTWLAACPEATAVDALRLSLGTLEGPDWHAQGVVLMLRPPGARTGEASLVLAARTLTLPEPVGQIRDIQINCPTFLADSNTIACKQGRLRLQHPWLKGPVAPLSLRYERGAGRWTVSAPSVPVAGGRWAMEGHGQHDRAALAFEGEAPAAGLWRLVAGNGPGAQQGGARVVVSAGRVRASGTVSAQAGRVGRVRARADLDGLGFSAHKGWVAGQGIAGGLEADASRDDGDWHLRARLRVEEGEAAAGPVFVAAPAQGLGLELDGRWDPSASRLRITDLTYRDPGMGTLAGHLSVHRGRRGLVVEAAGVKGEGIDLQSAYSRYLQPWLYGTSLSDLTVAGVANLAAEYGADAPLTVRVASDGLRVEDKGGRFGVQGLAGVLNWGSREGTAHSRVTWKEAHVFDWTIGRGQVHLASDDASLRLTQPVSIPVLDGTLQIETLRLTRPTTGHFGWRFDAILTPTSMAQVTKALGWPPMSGELSGVIPEVVYRDETLSVGGTLLVRAFDGQVLVRGLELVRPLGLAPRLAAEVEIKRIDLDKLTRHFAFGNIQGGISGYVRGLRMENWRPVTFDAWFATPPDDPLPHRISQKAVDNLSRIGGGVGGLVSRGFLRFFEEFRYARLGIGCRLADGTCHMKGLGSAGAGYTLVQGGGLPRIDVIGYNERVDWDVLVRRLQAVTETPTVQ